MQKYIAPKAEMLELSLTSIIMTSGSEEPCYFDSCADDGSGAQGASMGLQALV